jgi:hypothetical protein
VKKSIEASKDLFKIILWVLLIVFTVSIFYKVFNIFMEFQEKKKIAELKYEIENFLKDEGEYTVNTDYLCFSNSFNERKLKNMGIDLKINEDNLKIVGNDMLHFIKNGQAPVIIVQNKKVYKFYVRDLIFNEPVPVCFKKGDKIKAVEKFGGVSVEKIE